MVGAAGPTAGMDGLVTSGQVEGRGDVDELPTEEVEREVVGEGEVRGGELAHVLAGGRVGEEVGCEGRVAGDPGAAGQEN